MAKKKPKSSNGSPREKPPKGLVIIQKTQIPIARNVPSDLPTVFSNHFVVQHEDATFTLMFFEVRPPIVLTEGDAAKAEFAAIREVEANCVSRIVMPITEMPKVIRAMQENFAKHQAKASGTAEIIDVTPSQESRNG